MKSFLNNCRKSTINRQVLSDAREVRNKMAHSSYQHLSESETNECLQRLSNLLNSLEISSTFSGNYASVRLGHLKNLDFLKILSKKDVSIDPRIKQDLESHIREIISKIVIEDRRRSFPIIAILSILFWSLGTTICILTYGIFYLNGSEISSSFRQDVNLCDDSHISNAFQISGDASTLGAISYNGAQLDPIKITRALNHAVDRGQLLVVTCLNNVGGAYNNFSLLISVRSPSVSKHMVEFILKTGNWTAEQKEEALHESCFRGNLEIVKYLLQNGAKYNEYTLLTTISGPDDNKYMVDFILKSGNWSENQKMEGMDAAIFRGKLNTVRLLYKMNTSFSNFSLLTAVRSRFDDKHLVQFISASKKWTEEQKTEALDAACYRGKINTVINLHQNGAQFSKFSLLTSVKSPGDNKDLIEFVFKTGSWTKEQVVEAINETQYQKKLKLFLFLTRSFKPTLSYEKGTYSLVRYNFRESFDHLEAV